MATSDDSSRTVRTVSISPDGEIHHVRQMMTCWLLAGRHLTPSRQSCWQQRKPTLFKRPSLPPSLPPSPPLPSQCPSTPVRHSHESNDRNSRRRFLRRGYFGDAAQIGTQYRQRREEAGSPRKEGKEGRRTNVDDLSSSS